MLIIFKFNTSYKWNIFKLPENQYYNRVPVKQKNHGQSLNPITHTSYINCFCIDGDSVPRSAGFKFFFYGKISRTTKYFQKTLMTNDSRILGKANLMLKLLKH
jgi:hypothetical protein